MLCITADTHGDYSRFLHKKIKTLRKDDVLLICGDFGFIWDGSPKEKSILKKIGAKKHKTLFISGGHENHSLLSEYPETELFGGQARCICGNLYMLGSGEIFDIDGLKLFTFGGGQPSDIDVRIENSPWWDQEVPEEQCIDSGRKKLAELGNKVDYIITHEPPASIAEFLDGGRSAVSPMSRLNIFFDELKTETEFKMWFFGKLHRNKIIPPKYAAVFDEPYIIETEKS